VWACANLTKSKPCESGKFKQVAGSANCEWCGPNSESEEGEPLCACVAGFSLSDSGDCIACEPGTFQSGTDKDLGHAKCAQQENTRTSSGMARQDRALLIRVDAGSNEDSDCECNANFFRSNGE